MPVAGICCGKSSITGSNCVCFRKRFKESDYQNYSITEKTIKHELAQNPRCITNCGMVTPTLISSCGNLQPPWSLRWYRQPLTARRHGASSGSAWRRQMLKGVGCGGVRVFSCPVQSSVRSETWEKSHVIPKACSLACFFLSDMSIATVQEKWRAFKRSTLKFFNSLFHWRQPNLNFFGLQVWSFGVFSTTSWSVSMDPAAQMFP